MNSARLDEGANVVAKAMPSAGPANKAVNETTMIAISERFRTKRFGSEVLGSFFILLSKGPMSELVFAPPGYLTMAEVLGLGDWERSEYKPS